MMAEIKDLALFILIAAAPALPLLVVGFLVWGG
jgi:hypothetical protein